MEIGIFTFVEHTDDPATGKKISAQQRIKDLLEEAELAEKVGLDIFGIGEHHRPDFLASSPATLLAAAAARTNKIKLTSAVTVLSSDDPVRVFQQFAEVDLISNGRAEIMAGRGSFTESFPLFGYSLNDYDELFSEKLDLLLKIRDSEKVSWSGNHRSELNDIGVYPRPSQNKLPVWLAAGGNPGSAVRAGKLGLPLALAIIGGNPAQFVPFVDLYKQTYREHHKGEPQVSINSHGFIAGTTEKAIKAYWPHYEYFMEFGHRERGWPKPTREGFDAGRAQDGAMVLGSPEEVAEKIIYEHRLFGNTRFNLQVSIATMAHDKVLHCIELLGTKVAPTVRKKTI